MLSIFFFYGGFALMVLRLAVAAILIVHGWAKVRDLKGTSAWFGSVGFRPGAFWGSLAAVLEFGGGIALVLGFLVQYLATILALQFVVILFWRWFRRMPFVGGWELDLIMCAALVALMLLGGGLYSLDRVLLPVL